MHGVDDEHLCAALLGLPRPLWTPYAALSLLVAAASCGEMDKVELYTQLQVVLRPSSMVRRSRGQKPL